MSPRSEQAEAGSTSFDQAVEKLKGFTCFSQIPLERFDDAIRNAVREEKTPQVARGRIAQIIWQDEVDNSLSHLSYLEKKEVAERIRDAVNEIVARYWPRKRAADLRLVQPAG